VNNYSLNKDSKINGEKMAEWLAAGIIAWLIGKMIICSE